MHGTYPQGLPCISASLTSISPDAVMQHRTLQLLVCTDRGLMVGLQVRTYKRICTGAQVHTVRICAHVYLSDTDTYTPHRTIHASAPHLLMPIHSLNRFKARHLGSAGEVAVAVTSVPSCRKPWSILAGKIGFSVKSRRQYYLHLSLSQSTNCPLFSSIWLILFPEQPDGGRTTVVCSIEAKRNSCTYSSPARLTAAWLTAALLYTLMIGS